MFALRSNRLRALLLLGLTAGVQASAFSQDAASDGEALVLKVYPVADLVQPIPDFTFAGGLPGGASRSLMLPNTGGSSGGVVGGAGGGFFSVADDVLRAGLTTVAQTPVGAAGSAGGGGNTEHSNSPRFRIDQLRDAVMATVTPNEWEENGGAAVCQILGMMLVIKQTPAAHEEIDQLLAAIRRDGGVATPIAIDALWLTLDERQLQEILLQEKAAEGAAFVDPTALSELAVQAAGYRTQIRCFSDQNVHMVSGERRTLSVGIIPTVGMDAVAYQAVTQVPNIGLLLETRASLVPQSDAALVHLSSTLTNWTQALEPLVTAGMMPLDRREGSPEAAKRGSNKPGQPGGPSPSPAEMQPGSVSMAGVVMAAIDRVGIETHQMVASVKLPLGKPMLVGALSRVSGDDATSGSGGPSQQVYLFLTVNKIGSEQ